MRKLIMLSLGLVGFVFSMQAMAAEIPMQAIIHCEGREPPPKPGPYTNKTFIVYTASQSLQVHTDGNGMFFLDGSQGGQEITKCSNIGNFSLCQPVIIGNDATLNIDNNSGWC